jgi:hypothetical protein
MRTNRQPALLSLDLCEEAIEIGEIRYVSLHTRDVLPDLLDSRGQLAVAAPGYEDEGAFVGEPLRARKTDAAIAASDERNLSFELTHGEPPRLDRDLPFSALPSSSIPRWRLDKSVCAPR